MSQTYRNQCIIFIGSPLAGKGTQAQLLAQVSNIPLVSTGHLFRNEIQLKTYFGKQIQSFMDKGELIPNELTKDFLINKLTDPIYRNGFILDGFPRNISHLKIFEEILNILNVNIGVVIYLNVPLQILKERSKQRKRNDDQEKIFQQRYEIFVKETIPLIDLFKSRTPFLDIQLNQHSIEQIHQFILHQLNIPLHKSIDHLYQ